MRKGSMMLAGFALVVLWSTGCGDNRHAPAETKSAQVQDAGGSRDNVGVTPLIRDKIKGSLTNDLAKLNPAMDIRLVDFRVVRDNDGFIVEATWKSSFKPTVDSKNEGLEMPTTRDPIIGPNGKRSRLRYSGEGVFVRRIEDDQGVRLP